MPENEAASTRLRAEDQGGDSEGHEAPVATADVSALQQEVIGLRDFVEGAIAETSLDEKVETLRGAIDRVNEEVISWRGRPKQPDIEMVQSLKAQVEAVQAEWKALTSGFQAQRERLDALLQSFPGVVEVSAVRALALRVSHLEELVDQLLAEQRARAARSMSKIQLWVSLAALGVTIVLWGVFILTNILGE
ncbi:MAG: hypothetical protein WD645_05325 [Dehalococcoidia bacterium]